MTREERQRQHTQRLWETRWPVGTPVRVTRLAVRYTASIEGPGGRTKHIREWQPGDALPEDKQRATVTGYTRRVDGEYVRASGGRVSLFSGEDDFEPAYLAPVKTHRVVCVRFSPTGREHVAFPQDIRDDWDTREGGG